MKRLNYFFKTILNALRIVYSQKKYFIITLVLTFLFLLILGLSIYIEYFFSELFLRLDFYTQIIIILAFVRNIIFSNIPLTLFTNFLISLLFSINLVLIYYKYKLNKKLHSSSGIMGSVGVIIGLLAGGCSSCSFSILALAGASSIVYLLPFNGNELTFLGIIILFISIYFASKSIVGVCKIKNK